MTSAAPAWPACMHPTSEHLTPHDAPGEALPLTQPCSPPPLPLSHRLPAAAFLEYEDVRDAEDAIRKLDGYKGWVSVPRDLLGCAVCLFIRTKL